eukprot:ANDGO_04729.mRNA.1 hypothetical protein
MQRKEAFALFDLVPKSTVRNLVNSVTETACLWDAHGSDSLPSSSGFTGVSSNSSAVQSMTKAPTLRLLIVAIACFFFLYTVGMLGFFFVNYFIYMQVQYDPAEIIWSGQLSALCSRVLTVSRQWDASLMLQRDNSEMLSTLRSQLDQLSSAYKSIRFGDTSRHLPGITADRTTFMSILFDRTCNLTGLQCAGMDATLLAFIEELSNYAQMRAADITSATWPAAAARVQNAAVIYERWLRLQLDGFRNQMTVENKSILADALTTLIAVYCSATLLVGG